MAATPGWLVLLWLSRSASPPYDWVRVSDSVGVAADAAVVARGYVR